MTNQITKGLLVFIAVLAMASPATAQFGKISKVKVSVVTEKKQNNNASSSATQQEEKSASVTVPQSSQTPEVHEAPAAPATVEHIDDQGITSATHQKYVGKIVWSNGKVSMDSPDESRFKTKFNAGETIYGRYYLAESLQNFVLKQENTEVRAARTYTDIYIDGVLQDLEFEPAELTSEQIIATTRQIWVHTPITADAGFGGTKRWIDLVNKKMTPGEHVIRFDLRIEDCKGVLATGSFTYVKGTPKLKYGWNFGSYPTGMKDAALEASILKYIQNAATAQGWDEKFSKVKIYSNDWNTLRNDYGVILGRTIGAYCYATWPDGHCTVQAFAFKQDYNGSAYSKTLGLFKNFTQDEVDCE